MELSDILRDDLQNKNPSHKKCSTPLPLRIQIFQKHLICGIFLTDFAHSGLSSFSILYHLVWDFYHRINDLASFVFIQKTQFCKFINRFS